MAFLFYRTFQFYVRLASEITPIFVWYGNFVYLVTTSFFFSNLYIPIFCTLQTKEKYGKECKICCRPFTVFRWCPGARMRFKKTEICQTCSKLKNVCQTCLLDLEYGLPIQVRDAALKIQDDLPRNEVNKEYYIQNLDSQMSKFDPTQPSNSALKSKGASDLLVRLARTAPYYKRNRPHVCSFWVKGECRRGEECPYRHEKPTDPDDPLADQNIKDRYVWVAKPALLFFLSFLTCTVVLVLKGRRLNMSVTSCYIIFGQNPDGRESIFQQMFVPFIYN